MICWFRPFVNAFVNPYNRSAHVATHVFELVEGVKRSRGEWSEVTVQPKK